MEADTLELEIAPGIRTRWDRRVIREKFDSSAAPETGPVEGPAVSSSETPRNPAVDTADTSQQGALTPGANSFTEGQAREAIEKQGYTDVGALSQNDQGVWSATATRTPCAPAPPSPTPPTWWSSSRR